MGKLLVAAAAGFLGLLMVTMMAFGGGHEANAQTEPGGCGPGQDTGGSGGGASDGSGGAGRQQQASMDANQTQVAKTIVAVGKGNHIKQHGTAIALAVAMQESHLDPHAVSPGGRSVGIYQQQGALYAGVDRSDPAQSADAFYQQLRKRVPDYNSKSVADAGQAVQASGAGASYYAKWERWSVNMAKHLYSGTPAKGGGNNGGQGQVNCRPGGGSGPIKVMLSGKRVQLPAQSGVTGPDAMVTFDSRKTARAAAAGLSYLGTTYAWGGGGPNGPTKGIHDGGVADAHGDYNKRGFDCSGLMQYSYAQAGVSIPGTSSAQRAAMGKTVPYSKAKPGDLLFYGQGTSGVHHIAMYLGKPGGRPMMLEAPNSGSHVRVAPVRTGGDFQHQLGRPAAGKSS